MAETQTSASTSYKLSSNVRVNELNMIRDSNFVKERVKILESMGVDFDAPYFDDTLYNEYCKTDGTNAYPITLYYKSLTISNDAGHKLDVYDTYVRIYIGEDGRILMVGRAPLQMIRTTATRSQFKAGYTHSHPGGGSFTHFFCPCAGQGPLVSIIIDKGKYLIGDNFRAFIIAIKPFLEWEDSGYDYISKIIVQEMQSRRHSEVVFSRSPHEKHIIRQLVRRKAIKVVILNGGISVEFDNKALVQILSLYFPKGLFVVRSGGTYSIEEDTRPTTRHVLVYKGEKKYLKMVDGEVFHKVVNPEFQEVLRAIVRKKLIQKINERRKSQGDKTDPHCQLWEG